MVIPLIRNEECLRNTFYDEERFLVTRTGSGVDRHRLDAAQKLDRFDKPQPKQSLDYGTGYVYLTGREPY